MLSTDLSEYNYT